MHCTPQNNKTYSPKIIFTDYALSSGKVMVEELRQA